MIASNYRKHPEALALQMCLAFTRTVWHTARPGSRLLRAIRAARTAAIKALPTVPAWLPPLTIEPDTTIPAWARTAMLNARALGIATRNACAPLFA